MKIKDYKCPQCRHDDFFLKDKCGRTGIYCSYCDMWNKWVDKNGQNLDSQYGKCFT